MLDPVESNKDVIRRLLAEVDRGNLDVVDGYYAPGYVDHTPSPIRSLAPGRDGVRQALALFHQAFPDTTHTIEDLVAEGDRVVARISARGTHTGELFGHAPTGRVVTLTGITIYRIVEGRIAERWAEHGLGVLDQLGIAAPRREEP
jgi:predicted ester cyclase